MNNDISSGKIGGKPHHHLNHHNNNNNNDDNRSNPYHFEGCGPVEFIGGEPTFQMKAQLTPEQNQKLKTCYREMIDKCEEILFKHYNNQPLSPFMLNRIYAPLYTYILDHITSYIPNNETRYKVRQACAADLLDTISFVQQMSSRKEMNKEGLE